MSGDQVNAGRRYNIRERLKVTLTVQPEVVEQIDKIRGTNSRNAWIIEACRARLEREWRGE
jgi:hypothetical protein